MFGSVILALSLVPTVAHAEGEKLLRYDSWAVAGDEQFVDLLLIKWECMATVFDPEPEDYPVVPTQVHMFLGGDTGEMLANISIYSYVAEADVNVMNAGTAILLDTEQVLLDAIPITGVWWELILDERSFNLDPINVGSVIVSVCYENEQYLPIIGMDTNGFDVEESDIREDSADRHLLLKGGGGGPWLTIEEYTVGSALTPGDFLMRLVVDTNVTADTGLESGLAIDQIVPESQQAGDSISVLVNGAEFESGATAKIGSLDLTGVTVDGTGEHINGRTSPELSEGVYDVFVTNPDGVSQVLESAYTVVGDTKGCGCGAGSATAAAWWISVLGLAWRRRRTVA